MISRSRVIEASGRAPPFPERSSSAGGWGVIRFLLPTHVVAGHRGGRVADGRPIAVRAQARGGALAERVELGDSRGPNQVDPPHRRRPAADAGTAPDTVATARRTHT